MQEKMFEFNQNEIKSIRTQLNMTGEQFGQLFGVTGAQVSRWERGLQSVPAQSKVVLEQMKKKLQKENDLSNLKSVLIGGGIIALLVWVFKTENNK